MTPCSSLCMICTCGYMMIGKVNLLLSNVGKKIRLGENNPNYALISHDSKALLPGKPVYLVV